MIFSLISRLKLLGVDVFRVASHPSKQVTPPGTTSPVDGFTPSQEKETKH